MTKRDESATKHPIQGRAAAPPPEPKVVVTVRLYEDDVEMLRRNYGGYGQPIRRMVRRVTDRLRRDHDIPPKGQPKE